MMTLGEVGYRRTIHHQFLPIPRPRLTLRTALRGCDPCGLCMLLPTDYALVIHRAFSFFLFFPRVVLVGLTPCLVLQLRPLFELECC